MTRVYELSKVEGSPTIFVAQPNLRLISPYLVVNRFSEAKNHTLLYFAPEAVTPHDRARNLCVKAFLETNADYMFWLDDDSYLERPVLKQFLDADKDYIAGVFQTIKMSPEGPLLLPTVMNMGKEMYAPAYGMGLTEVEVAPLACALIKRCVIEDVEKPAFSWGDMFDEWGIEGYGEDVFFCRRVREKGYRIWADFRTLGHHWLRMDTLAVNHMLRRVAEGEVG
jgi:hypothetical protein